MCWVAVTEEELTPKIAEDNIPVEKIVMLNTTIYNEPYWCSAYFNKIYDLNTTYKTNDMHLEGCIVKEGFHSYKGVKIIFNKELERIYIYDKNKIRLDSWHIYNKAIMSCVIPKGSMYYENNHGEIVSNAITPIYAYKL